MKVPILIPNIFNHPFTYDDDSINLEKGDYVTVPFGKRKVVGIVCAINSESDIHPSKLKSIIAADNEIIFDVAMFKLLNFVSDYYHYPIGQTIMSVVPARLKKNLNQYILAIQGVLFFHV